MSSENYRSASKTHDPGWNDPPKVAIGTNEAPHTAPSQTKPLLNKRVAFPLQSGTPATAAALAGPPGGAPMVAGPPPSGGPPVTFRRRPTSESSGDQHEPVSAGTESREDQFRLLQSALNECVERLDTNRRPEVQKRLNLINEAWSGEKLGAGLEQYLHQFATALKEQDATRAGSVHRSIICDFGSKCTLWAPALRQLIFALPPTDSGEQPSDSVIVNPI
ncbi:steroid receptor RNA activator 1-like [Anopheles aquasalis]|uniref:steroid receptor RNA activator 1-like n=1 Tax=Anopheles aquasalis TaxID=42839 RepID=UPI00215A4477|nr:steroid receptor RNA activator 1-like [Anopheles aquasalis]